jgi:hypothetical protein
MKGNRNEDWNELDLSGEGEIRSELSSVFCLLGSGFWVLGSGFWVLGSGFWVLGSGFWVLGSGFSFFSSNQFMTIYLINAH